MSETEPTYEYIKGQGWVANTDLDTITVTNAHGTWTLINRKPEVGEHYALFYKTDRFYDGGKVKIREYANYIAASNWSDWSQRMYIPDELRENYAYCVVVFQTFK